MKKNLLIALAAGLMTVLAGCVVVVATPKVSSPIYRSSWVLASNSQPVFCDNKVTQIEYSFKYNTLGDIVSWTENWTGQAPSSPTYNFTLTTSSQGVTVDTASKRITVVVSFNPGTSPFSARSNLSAQAITPVPVPLPPTSQTGNAFLKLTFTLTSGTVSFSTYTYPVYSGC